MKRKINVVVSPMHKDTQHMKIVLNDDGTLRGVELYKDSFGKDDKIRAVYEVLEQEILIVFGSHAVNQEGAE